MHSPVCEILERRFPYAFFEPIRECGTGHPSHCGQLLYSPAMSDPFVHRAKGRGYVSIRESAEPPGMPVILGGCECSHGMDKQNAPQPVRDKLSAWRRVFRLYPQSLQVNAEPGPQGSIPGKNDELRKKLGKIGPIRDIEGENPVQHAGRGTIAPDPDNFAHSSVLAAQYLADGLSGPFRAIAHRVFCAARRHEEVSFGQAEGIGSLHGNVAASPGH
jgi:hypothetical protein